ncbi:hypothetical protein a10_08286 [Streptomyces acidiscabies]|nr:hypothetical protein a10_08286 [Streptomyces acidiscabies]
MPGGVQDVIGAAFTTEAAFTRAAAFTSAAYPPHDQARAVPFGFREARA